jgi:hypothetical protein
VRAGRERGLPLYKVAWGAALLAFVLFGARARLPYGFSLTDEGFVLASASRYLLGDVPFRDEAFTALRSSDLVLAALMRLLPFDTVLLWRWVGYGFQLGSLALLALLLSRRLPFLPLTLLLTALAFYTPFNLWTPQYANLGILVVLAATSLWLLGASSPRAPTRRLLGFLGGAVFSTCAVVYTPLLAAGLLPLGLLLLGPRTGPWRPVREATLLFLTGCLGGVGVFLAALSAAGLAGSFVAALGALQSVSSAQPGEGSAQAIRIYDFRGDLPSFLLYRAGRAGLSTLSQLSLVFLVFAFLGVVSTRAPRGWLRLLGLWAAVAGLAAGGAAFVLLPDDTPYLTLSPRLTSVTVALTALAAGAAAGSWRRRCDALPADRARNVAAPLLLGVGIVATLIVTMSTDNGVGALNVGGWLLWPGAVGVLGIATAGGAWGRAGGSGEPAGRAGWALLPVTALLLAVSLHHAYGWTYEDGRPAELNTPFAQRKLRGIYSSSERVRAIETMTAALEERVGRGDFLLAYGNVPGLVYLTDTRPATQSSLVYRGSPSAPVMEAWIRRMVETGRVPRYAVVAGALEGSEPFEEFVLRRYRRELEGGGLQLWALEGA